MPIIPVRDWDRGFLSVQKCMVDGKVVQQECKFTIT